jgi:hypothetical protein
VVGSVPAASRVTWYDLPVLLLVNVISQSSPVCCWSETDIKSPVIVEPFG